MIRFGVSILCFLFVALTAQAAGNGSSGVGNAKHPLAQGLAALLPSNSIRSDGKIIRDSLTSEPLLDIARVRCPGETRLSDGSTWIASLLGEVKGYELVPQMGAGRAMNRWVICGRDGSAGWQLSPLSRTHPKVMQVIGGLVDDSGPR